MHTKLRLILAIALCALTCGVRADDPPPKKPDKSGTEAAEHKSGKVDMSAVPADEKAEKDAMEAVGEGFKVKRTLHYSVLFNTSEQDVATFNTAIETTYRSCMNYVDKLGITPKKPSKKLIIFYFEEHKDYAAFAVTLGKGALPQSTPGVYFPDLNRSMFYNFQNQASFKGARQGAEAKIAELQSELKRPGISPADRKRIAAEIKAVQAEAHHSSVKGGGFSESIVQHEVSHQVLWNIGFHNQKHFFGNPRWLAEGTAMMFEPISQGGSANFGAVNAQRLGEYQQLEKTNKLIPVKQFITTHEHFAPATIAIAYPESWALVHYLNRVKRPQLKAYVEDILKRPADYKSEPDKELADFEKAFGKIDDKWVRTWKDWMTKVHADRRKG